MNDLHLRREQKYRKSKLSEGLRLVSCATGVAGLLFAAQAAYVMYATPKLTAPKHSGRFFVDDGILVNHQEVICNNEEFQLILIGDSPIEGIGHDNHYDTVGGQTALAFSKALGRPVRFWCYGKSGLTADGIRKEMLPFLMTRIQENNIRPDLIVLSVGVNNVLLGQSASAFRNDATNLLQDIESCCRSTKVLVLELLDFASMPFLPYPLKSFLSWRSKILQKELQQLVFHMKQKKSNIAMSYLPNVKCLLGGNRDHSLWDHLQLSQEERQNIAIEDFFAKDKFHPGGYGCKVIGKNLVDTFMEDSTIDVRHLNLWKGFTKKNETT